MPREKGRFQCKLENPRLTITHQRLTPPPRTQNADLPFVQTLPNSRVFIKDKMFKLQAIFNDGSVGMEFMTDDPSEAEDMRERWLAFDCVAEVLILDLPGWVSL
jgi:hypothetical protein